MLDPSPVQRIGGYIGTAWDISTWAYLAMLSVVVVSRMSDGSAPVFLQPLQAGFPIVAGPVWIVLAVAVLTRRWLQVPLCLILAVGFVAAVSPARQRVAPPYWVAGAPTVRVAAANVYFANTTPDTAARSLLARDPDVIVVAEFTGTFRAAFNRAGVADRYPNVSERPRDDPAGAVIYSKLPFAEVRELTELKMPAVRLILPAGGYLWVAAVHPFPPTGETEGKRWMRCLKDLRRFAEGTAGDDPLAMVGDFNGTRWQPSFGQLLAGSTVDAHEALGKGLSRSWPAGRAFPRLVRLDHALINERAFPVAIQDFEVPGSDHRAFDVTIAVRSIKAPGVLPGEDSIVGSTVGASTSTRKPGKSR